MKRRVINVFLSFAIVLGIVSGVCEMSAGMAKRKEMPTLVGDTDEYFEALGIAYGSKARMGELHILSLANAQKIIRQKMASVCKEIVEDYMKVYGNNEGTDIETKMERSGKQFLNTILNDTREIGSPEFSEMDEKGNVTCYVVARMYKKGLAEKMADFLLKSEELKGKVEEAPLKRVVEKHFDNK